METGPNTDCYSTVSIGPLPAKEAKKTTTRLVYSGDSGGILLSGLVILPVFCLIALPAIDYGK